MRVSIDIVDGRTAVVLNLCRVTRKPKLAAQSLRKKLFLFGDVNLLLI